jgi:hypothetical protein
MESYSHTTIVADKSKLDMTWLLGRTISKVEKLDYSWFFVLDDGGSIGTESPWRLVTADGIVVTSEDDGHLFGLAVPLNAAETLTKTVAQRRVGRFELREGTNDLVLHFTNNVVIEFLNLSCGYDGWRTRHGKHEVFCLGGGRLGELCAK